MTARDLDRELDNAAERHDWLTGRDDDRTEYHAALGGYEEPPAAWEVADLEEDGW